MRAHIQYEVWVAVKHPHVCGLYVCGVVIDACAVCQAADSTSLGQLAPLGAPPVHASRLLVGPRTGVVGLRTTCSRRGVMASTGDRGVYAVQCAQTQLLLPASLGAGVGVLLAWLLGRVAHCEVPGCMRLYTLIWLLLPL